MTSRSPSYLSHFIAGERPHGSQTVHYWRWPIRFHLRMPRLGRKWLLRPSIHGVRDGVVHVKERGRGIHPLNPACRSFLWVGPFGIEFGWRRQVIEDWRWRRALSRQEHGDD